MNVAIIKYNAGNIRSVDYALRRLGIEPVITDDKEFIRRADRVIFPGVGEASTTMQYLHERGLDVFIPELRQPVLGICLGMQLMCRYSYEGDTRCMGIFDADVVRFESQKHEDKIPHMGWNTISDTHGALFNGFIPDKKEYVYFVHSFYVPTGMHTAATTTHIHPFSAALQKQNFFATQFHPEKSGGVGERILQNFLDV
ncbi:MAG: imidazole glycerol phosphate synthase subunit HisH [Mediterranea sp.]|jgi:glutamine amidotransferase|nr:imidazole glycerol phosphate synthase subunit HisH [Mediterranea sp.]